MVNPEAVPNPLSRCQRRGSGRPRVTERPGFQTRFGAILERLGKGEISRRRAAKELGIGYATLKRLLGADNTDRREGET